MRKMRVLESMKYSVCIDLQDVERIKKARSRTARSCTCRGKQYPVRPLEIPALPGVGLAEGELSGH